MFVETLCEVKSTVQVLTPYLNQLQCDLTPMSKFTQKTEKKPPKGYHLITLGSEAARRRGQGAHLSLCVFYI